MNETEVRGMFEALTQSPIPSRYDAQSVRVASTRRQHRKWSVIGVAVVVGCVIAGTVLLVGPGASVKPSPVDTPPSKTVTLDGEWTVRALFDSTEVNVQTVALPETNRLRFHAGILTGSFGCFEFAGNYTQSGVDGRDLVFPKPVVSTGAPDTECGESPVAARLAEVRHASESNGVLFLQSATWTNIARLEQVRASTDDSTTLTAEHACPANAPVREFPASLDKIDAVYRCVDVVEQQRWLVLQVTSGLAELGIAYRGPNLPHISGEGCSLNTPSRLPLWVHQGEQVFIVVAPHDGCGEATPPAEGAYWQLGTQEAGFGVR